MSAKLSWEEAQRIRQMKRQGFSVGEISDYFRVSEVAVRNILKGRAYRTPGGETQEMVDFRELHEENPEELMKRLQGGAAEESSSSGQYEVSEELRRLAEELSGKKIE